VAAVQTWSTIHFQVLTAESMKIIWDVAPCSLVEVDWRFRGAYCLHHGGERSRPTFQMRSPWLLCLDRPYDTSSFLSNGQRGSFLGAERSGREADRWSHIVLRLWMGGAIPPLPHTLASFAAYLSTSRLYLYLKLHTFARCSEW
jgi:hypothetical protein